MAAEEGIDQRVGKADDLDKRYHAGACDLPAMCMRKVFAPEDLPAGDGPLDGTEMCGKLTDSAWSRPPPHGADEGGDAAEIDLSHKEAYRRRCQPLPAAVVIAAEAQSLGLMLREQGGGAAWLS